MNVFRFGAGALIALAVGTALAACDSDPSRPTERLELNGCPTGAQDVNAPITLDFNVPLLARSVAPGNVVVTDAITGIEIPGTLTSQGSQVTFTPSAPFRFSQRVRIRIQNLLSQATMSQVPVTLCEITTVPPPITELPWRSLPHAGGLVLRSVDLTAPDTGYVLSQLGVLFKRSGTGDFVVQYQNPYYNAGFATSFVNSQHGFLAVQNVRIDRPEGAALILETKDGGATFDSLFTLVAPSLPGWTIQRLFFRQVGTGASAFAFGAFGGGNTGRTLIYKYRPESGTFTEQLNTTASGYTNDIDFAPGDTTKGVAVTNGIRVGSFTQYGHVYVSTDGGSSWSDVANMVASDSTLTYFAAGVRTNGEIYVGGGNGFFARLTPNGGGGYTVTRLLADALTSFNRADPFALIFTDVEFAPDDDNVGWLIGAQQVGVDNGTPRYQGVIFMTRDGGQTWTRQGVIDAPNYGAEFPRLNRISVLSKSAAWIAGDGGTVLSYEP